MTILALSFHKTDRIYLNWSYPPAYWQLCKQLLLCISTGLQPHLSIETKSWLPLCMVWACSCSWFAYYWEPSSAEREKASAGLHEMGWRLRSDIQYKNWCFYCSCSQLNRSCQRGNKLEPCSITILINRLFLLTSGHEIMPISLIQKKSTTGYR